MEIPSTYSPSLVPKCFFKWIKIHPSWGPIDYACHVDGISIAIVFIGRRSENCLHGPKSKSGKIVSQYELALHYTRASYLMSWDITGQIFSNTYKGLAHEDVFLLETLMMGWLIATVYRPSDSSKQNRQKTATLVPQESMQQQNLSFLSCSSHGVLLPSSYAFWQSYLYFGD